MVDSPMTISHRHELIVQLVFSGNLLRTKNENYILWADVEIKLTLAKNLIFIEDVWFEGGSAGCAGSRARGCMELRNTST